MSTPTQPGYVEAVVGQLGVVNANGALLLPGCLTKDTKVVLVSAFNHGLEDGDEPIGMGEVFEEDGHIIFRGRLSVWMPRPRAIHDRLRVMGRKTRWSIAFEILQSHEESRDGRTIEVIRQLRVYEVSPVAQPASAGTYTRALVPI